jgi:hypothetical protein
MNNVSLVGLFGQGVELGNGIVESLFGKVTSSVGAVEDLVAAVYQFRRFLLQTILTRRPRSSMPNRDGWGELEVAR